MDNTKEQIIETVIEQIKKDIEVGDVTALFELLKHITQQNLESFLPEH